ncbi:NACHT domain-containing protein [Metapseudomonas otitidis]
MKIENIKAVYQRYGFTLEEERIQEGLLAFLLVTGPFRNIEIVKIKSNADPKPLEAELIRMGYSCATLDSTENLENRLFDSFFSVNTYRNKIKTDYKNFTKSISKKYSDSSEYKYLSAPYLINGKTGTKDISEEILERINEEKPIIFVVEAAAGYGKTCAAYELASKINEMDERIPLLTELSRNRQARIFKHVLLDEIDRSFPSLSSTLVKEEIASGRIITILDGFDELLRENEESDRDFDSKEPMLETIGEYLKENAKIILTTRKTMLFDGDGFHKWIENNKSEFSLVKIQINEPKVTDWLDSDRREALEASNIEIQNIANPVLLSFLRYISDEELKNICQNPEGLVESYFKFILDREKTRQDLAMTAEEQNSILDIVARDMIVNGYKSEDRSYIMDLILTEGIDLIEKTIEQYAAEEKPSPEAIANKLASHAFLDRSSRNPTKIEFINEFVFGHYIARDIYNDAEWINDDWRYLEPAIFSHKTRAAETKQKLWEKLENSLEFVSLTNKISASLSLLNNINFDISQGEINTLNLREINVAKHNKIHETIFNNCQFTNCTFTRRNISNVSFFECKFFNCKIDSENTGSWGKIFTPGSTADNDILDKFTVSDRESPTPLTSEETSAAEAAVLEKFWPVGRETITHKHRPIRGICNFADSGNISPQEMYDAITSLKRKGILSDARSSLFVEINLSAIKEIKQILGR